jgi:hypothetical protein
MAVNQLTTKNYTIPKGKIFFRRSSINSSGVETKLAGYDFLGNAPTVSFTVEVETKDHMSSTTCKVVQDDQVVVSTKVSGTINLDDIKPVVMSLFAQADEPVDDNIAASGVTDENITMYDGKLMKIGEANNIGAVTAVSVTGTGGTPTYTEGTDYNVDLEGGWLETIEGGGISDEETVEVDYTPVAQTRTKINVGSSPSIKGTLRFQSDPVQGHKHDFACDVTLSPDGEMPLVSEDWQNANLKFTCRDTTDFDSLMSILASINVCS